MTPTPDASADVSMMGVEAGEDAADLDAGLDVAPEGPPAPEPLCCFSNMGTWGPYPGEPCPGPGSQMPWFCRGNYCWQDSGWNWCQPGDTCTFGSAQGTVNNCQIPNQE